MDGRAKENNSYNNSGDEQRYPVQVLRMGNDSVIDVTPFFSGMMYALSNIGKGKWKNFWRCHFDSELFSGMDPRGDALITWKRNEKRSLTEIGFLQTPP